MAVNIFFTSFLNYGSATEIITLMLWRKKYTQIIYKIWDCI